MQWLIPLISVAACLLTVYCCRCTIRRAFDGIDGVLDAALAQAPVHRASAVADSRSAKLIHKTERVVEMHAASARAAQAEKDTVQGLIADMAHQIKTPLAGIAMYSALLQEGNLAPAEQQEFIGRIEGSTAKLQWMMDCLIKMSRLEIGAITLSPKVADLQSTLADSIRMALPLAEKKNIKVVMRPFAPLQVYHDPRWTREVFANILENAVKYAPPGSGITVAVEPLQLYTKVIIQNPGSFIPQEERHLVFKRFYRGKNADGTEGAGLGLYLAALMMERQAGYIMADSVPDEFTAFSVFLQNCKQ